VGSRERLPLFRALAAADESADTRAMGDGMNGMAAAIVAVMLLMLAGGAALFWWLGRLVAKVAGWGGPRAALAVAVSAALGLGAGALLMTATFFESSWAPPPAVTLRLPPGYAHREVMLVEDPAVPRTLAWTGFEAPFHGKATVIAVPPGGIVRLRTLEGLAGRADATVTWSDGTPTTGGGGGPLPPGIGRGSYVVFSRGEPDVAKEPPWSDKAALAAWIRGRERQR
jgi:hypothetical protein